MTTPLKIVGYTLLNLRFASLLIPFCLVAYIAGTPAWMVWAAFGMLALAAGGEVFTATVNGWVTVDSEADVQDVVDAMAADAERFANGGWHGEEEGGGEGGNDEGQAPVPGR